MTNLNAVLQLYFVDEDLDDAIDKSLGSKSYITSKTFVEKGMDATTFTNLFIARNGMYGTDVVSGIHQLANRHWLSPLKGVKSRNIFNILAFATKNKLQWKNDEPICVYEDYLLWNDISRIIGEDLLTASYLALRHLQEGLDINSFAWKPNITANNPDLTNMLKKGLGELHYHLGGSSLIFDVSWMSLMNTEKIGAEVKRNLIRLDKNLYTWIEKARAARIFLFKYNKYKGARINQFQINKILKGSSNDIKIYAQDIGKEITKEKVNAYRLGSHCVDYAIDEEPTELDKKRYYNLPLIGERKLLYNLLTKIYNGDKDCVLSLYIYLLVKNKFRKYLIQNDRIKGFSHFQEIQGRKENFFEGYIYEKLFLFMAMQTTICNQPLQKLEMRVTPKKSSMNLQEALRNYNLCVNDSSLRLKLPNRVRELNAKAGYVLHFIKRSDNGIDSKKAGIVSCRNYKLRKKIEDQANAIAQLVHDNSMYVKGGIQSHSYNKEKSTLLGDIKNSIYPIIGIDAASSEFGCRPEVFGPAFRRLKYVTRINSLDSLYEKRDLQLGRTFHVGEDFYDIVDGLRAIDECISFLNFGCGDRIGHAVALGIDVYSYYKTRNFKVVMPKQVLLDNAVWLLKKMEEYSIDDKYGTKFKLNEIFEIYFNNIYEVNATINDYYASWMLRGDEPSRQIGNSNYLWKPFLKNQNNPSLDFIRKNQKVMKLHQAYHFSAKAREIGDEMVEYQFDDGDARIIRDTQEKMRKKIAREKIAIETNPTSNLQITDIDRYSKHPITAFYNRGLTRDYAPEQITVSINTDDQGVFATSLEKEYTLIACALEKKRNDDGSPTYSPKDIYKWLDDIRESSLVSSFLEDDLN